MSAFSMRSLRMMAAMAQCQDKGGSTCYLDEMVRPASASISPPISRASIPAPEREKGSTRPRCNRGMMTNFSSSRLRFFIRFRANVMMGKIMTSHASAGGAAAGGRGGADGEPCAPSGQGSARMYRGRPSECVCTKYRG